MRRHWTHCAQAARFEARLFRSIVLKDAWNVDNGTMTPTMKVKRGEVGKRYAALMAKELQVRDAVGWE